MIDLVSQSRFFVGVVMGLSISKVVGLAIGGAVLMGTDIVISFFILFL